LDTAFWGEVSKSAQIKLDEAHIEKLFRRYRPIPSIFFFSSFSFSFFFARWAWRA
jgi:hypothetical protein